MLKNNRIHAKINEIKNIRSSQGHDIKTWNILIYCTVYQEAQLPQGKL